MRKIEIDSGSCKKCGICAEVCPHKIFQKDLDLTLIREERQHLCFSCGQCMAVCPSKAVTVDGLSYAKDFYPLPGPSSYEQSFFDLIRSRRAVRNFLDKPVPREFLEKIAEAITLAPPGFPPVKVEITPTLGVLKAALQSLLALKTRDYGMSGLYNALYQSTLAVQSVSLINGEAIIQLSGTFLLGGECDNPRVEAQLTQTAMQFPTVQTVSIYVNGKTLKEALSLR